MCTFQGFPLRGTCEIRGCAQDVLLTSSPYSPACPMPSHHPSVGVSSGKPRSFPLKLKAYVFGSVLLSLPGRLAKRPALPARTPSSILHGACAFQPQSPFQTDPGPRELPSHGARCGGPGGPWGTGYGDQGRQARDTRLRGLGHMGLGRPERSSRGGAAGPTFPALAASARPGPAQDVPASCLLSPGREPSSHTNRSLQRQPPQPGARRRDRLVEAGRRQRSGGGGEGTSREVQRGDSPAGQKGAGVFGPSPLASFQISLSWSAVSTQGVLGSLLRTCLLGTLVPADCPGPGPIRSGPSWLMGPKHVFNRCCLLGNTFVFYSFCSRYTKPSVEKAIQVSSSGNKATSNLIMGWQTGPRIELSAQSLVPGILRRCEIIAVRVPCTWELPS